MTAEHAMPESLSVHSDELPWVDAWMGVPQLRFQLLAADVEGSTFTVRIQFPPGLQLPPHHHTGAVHAWTLSGRWGYLEHPDARSRPGSYLYEPPGTTHTLKIADDNTGPTDVVFIIHGAMLVQDGQGRVEAVLDAASHLRDWAQALRDEGKRVPKLIVGGRSGVRQI